MTAPGPVKCARWLRVSTLHQDADNQIPEVGQFITHRGYEVAATYTVSDSAWKNGTGGRDYQEAMVAMLADAHAGKFSVVVVWAADRLVRTGIEELLKVTRLLKERGVTLVSVREPWLSGSDATAELLLAIAGWMAAQESQRRSDRIKAGLARRAAEGGHIGRKPGSRNKPKPARKRRAAAPAA
jgi:DNA invertase Pin-like site-specific DNA recombinase